MIKRIIFDVDNTLITNVDFYPFVENAFKYYGIYDDNIAHKFIDSISGYEKVYNRYDKDLYLKYFSDRLNIKLEDRFLQIFFDELKSAVSANGEQIKAMLDNLNDYELVLLSNYFEISQRNRLSTMGINDYFIEYYGEKLIKPNPEVYLEAASKNAPGECIIVGDDKKLDIDTPKSLGFKTIYVNPQGDIEKVEQINKELIKQKEDD